MQIRGQFSDFFGSTMLPMIDQKIDDGYQEHERTWMRLFKVDTMTGSIKSRSGRTGLGLAAEITAEGDEPRIDRILQKFKKQYVPRKFGISVEFSRELIDDDQFDVIADASMELGRSVRETCEIDAASTFNNAFSSSYTGPDGVSLCNSAHPMVKYGGTQSNVLSVAADLDVSSAELALIDWRKMWRDNGHFQSMPKPRLLVASDNAFNAYEIFKSPGRSDTANRTANAFEMEGGQVSEIIVWEYLTDPDAWFLVAPPERTGLRWFWRRKPDPIKDIDERTERAWRGVVYRKDHGFEDYMGVYGTPGA